MRRPLEGVSVLEVASFGFVPGAASVLGEWGATVTKVEHVQGEAMRHMGLATSRLFNRGKRSVALDVRDERGAAVLAALVANVDVFMTNFLPRTRQRLGIDVDDIRKVNPTVIYAKGSGFGARGPESESGGYDTISFWYRSGMAATMTPPGGTPPNTPTRAFGDLTSAAVLAGGIAAAIAGRQRTGEGCVLDASLLGVGLWASQLDLVSASSDARAPKYEPMAGNDPALYTAYPTADERWIGIMVLETERYWPGLCVAIGRDDLLADARFLDDASRRANNDALRSELAATFARFDTAQWQERLAHQDAAWTPVNRMSDVCDDPQVAANGFVQAVHHAEDDSVMNLVVNPIQFDGAPARIEPARELGADTEDALKAAGFTAEQIEAMRADGVIATA